MEGILWISLASGAAGLWVFIYFLRRGQFEEGEEAKFQLFRDEEK